jgi:hypothetical protein
MVLLGRVLWVKPGRYFEAESLLLAAIERLERVRGHDHPDTAAAMDGLGEAYAFNSYPDKAERLHREALRIHTKTLGEEHPATLYSLWYLANALGGQRRSEEAEAMTRKVLEARVRVLGPDHTDTLATQLSLAQELTAQLRYVEAEELHWESLAAHVRTLGPTHANTIHAQRFLAWCLEKQKKYSQAETVLRAALEVARAKYGARDSDTSIRLTCALAQLLGKERKDAEAEQVACEALALQQEQVPRPDPEELTQSSLALVGVLQRRRALDGELIDFWLAAAQAPDASAKTVDGAARRLLHAYNTELRDAPRAVQLSLQANEKARRENPYFLRTLAQAYAFTGDSVLAMQTWEMAAGLLVDRTARASMFNNAASELLFVTPDSYRKPAEALSFALRSNELSDYKTAEFLRTLAQAYARTGDPERAVQLWEQASLASADDEARAAMLAGGARDLLSAAPEAFRNPRLGLELAVKAARSPGATAEHMNSAAWHLLTVKDELRDPVLALEFALKANDIGRYQSAPCLDTLALAYHRAGDTAKAIDTQKLALSLLAPDAPEHAEYEKKLCEFERALGSQREHNDP